MLFQPASRISSAFAMILLLSLSVSPVVAQEGLQTTTGFSVPVPGSGSFEERYSADILDLRRFGYGSVRTKTNQRRPALPGIDHLPVNVHGIAGLLPGSDFLTGLATSFGKLNDGRCLRFFLDLPERGEDVDFEQSFPRLFPSYDEACLLKDLSWVPSELRTVVGILEVRSEPREPFCSVTLTGRRTAVTSRHCFVNRNGGYTTGCQTFHEPGLVVRFLEAPETDYRVEVLSTACSKHEGPYGFEEDLIEIELDRDVDTPAPARWAAAEEPLEESTFWLIGHSRYAREAHVGDWGAAEQFATIRYSPESTCGVLVSHDRCLLHSCQSAPGMSGAGLLRVGDEGVEILGIQTDASAPERDCGAETIRGVNRALRLTASP